MAAVFSTGSAINAPLFATARLARSVSAERQYPVWMGRTNASGAPYAAVLALGSVAALLAAIGGLSTLVEAASLVFLATFAIICFVAWRQRVGWRFGAAVGSFAAASAAIVLAGRLAVEAPIALAALAAAVVLTLVLRPKVKRRDARRHGDVS